MKFGRQDSLQVSGLCTQHIIVVAAGFMEIDVFIFMGLLLQIYLPSHAFP